MMGKGYIELRNSSVRGTDSLIPDMMRHLQTRQHLGKAVIVSDQPAITLSAARKQWFKLARALQKRRASTLNADKILKYTHSITHMQHLQFSAKSPLEQPGADIFFMQPQAQLMPVHCFSIYISTQISASAAEGMLAHLPTEALVIDYIQTADWKRLGLEPKQILENHVDTAWHQIRQFLDTYGIDISKVMNDGIRDVETMDDALDTLLGMSHKFLQVANEFQRALELARPMRVSKVVRENYDSLILLAHRVQALSPGPFNQYFLQAYNEEDEFFLHDPAATKLFLWAGESPEAAFARHIAAGRLNLAKALQRCYMGRSFQPTR
jgi:hypothetical protein